MHKDKKTSTDLSKKARKKYFSLHLASNLARNNPTSSLYHSYLNTLACAKVISIDEQGQTHAHYCKNRWCPTCQSIRTARLIEGYKDALKAYKELYFVTLTLPTCEEAELPAQIKRMGRVWSKIRKDRHFAGCSGLRKAECTLRPAGRYHYHYHILVDSKDGAEYLVKRWLQINKDADKKAQDIREVNRNNDNSLLEIFKYFTKLLAKNGVKKYIDYKRLDVIFRAMKGYRVFQSFGSLHAVKEDFTDEEVTSQVTDKAPGVWAWECSDWYNIETGEALTGYEPCESLAKLLEPLQV